MAKQTEHVHVCSPEGNGIGRGIALALAAAGARVAVVGRTSSTITAVADEIAARGAGRSHSSVT